MKFVTAALVSALVLSACGSSAPGRATTAEIANVDPSAAAGIRIAWEGSAVGQRWTKVEDLSMTAVITPAPGQSVEVITAEHGEQIHEVLAADGGAPTKLKVSYTKHRRTETIQGNAREQPTPTLGKTYVVWREGGELKASLGDGSAPSVEELNAVTKDNHGVGTPDVMGPLIASRVWNLDEPVALDDAQLAALEASWSVDGAKLSAMSLMLQAADDATATFAMTIAMGGSTAEVPVMRIEVEGTAVVERKTGRMRSLEMMGPLEGTVSPGSMKMNGTIATKAVYTY